MLVHPEFNRVAISIGPIHVYWYGLMYLVGFIAGWWLGVRRADAGRHGWSREEVGDLVSYVVLGIILGGRLGYVLFYKPAEYFADPLAIFRLWEGGMSFHGGLLGGIVALALFARSRGRSLLQVGDFVAPLVPVGLGAGRLGNFINQELWGRATDVPWAVLFPAEGLNAIPRHPSQLYEAGLEGVLLFVVLWWVSARPRPTGLVSGVFLTGYALVRMFVEFFREPDAYLGYLAFDWLTMGQLLSLPMLIVGLLLCGLAMRRPAQAAVLKEYP
ncbi:MAG: prolipoprotein diacylglyceryl transferase [Gammaproteobacteria bacterium]|jgi:phosphatidylglycerol:prolipoprotein diacylglycerol transferase|nr:prolipoprotein diacylglyceryl transferase [Gammaproteobacteria bacterium]